MQTLPNLIGQSRALLDCLEQVSRYAAISRPVLIIGERGTGKELIAQRLHFLSPRWRAPYVCLNCAALNAQLIDSELFGHKAGAFTGAQQKRVGRFEKAHGGSLFLDELANIPLSTQEKLLRVLEYGEFEALGSNHTQHINVKFIAATNEDLPHLVKQGKFRADLLDRLAFAVITLPPLRARQDDILLLAEYFSAQLAKELSITPAAFSPKAQHALLHYPWPGNVRELKNVVERAQVDHQQANAPITTLHFDPFVSPWRPHTVNDATHADLPALPYDFYQHLRTYEKALLTRALRQTQYRQSRCAKQLGLSYDQLRGLLKKHQLATK